MEPLDPSKTIEGSRHSRRRLSSILKAPRQSTTGIFCDIEQEENEVEIPKAVEKRKSKRVSFAQAEDVKNVSPARNPLQELMAPTAATAPNWVQVAVTEDRSEQLIMDIENLLNAPLHASQQRNVVNFDGGSDFGEKTVVFSTDDAIMDLTQSHTINIDSDADLLGDVSHHNILLTRGERRATVDDVRRSADTSQSVSFSSDRNKDSELLLDPDFENFLASLSKPSSSSTVKTVASTKPSAEEAKSKTQTVNKENQVPPSLKSRRSVGESLDRSVFCPADVNKHLTEARTERTVRGGDDDDFENPFQCLFPTQDMYAHCDRTSSQMSAMKLKKRQSLGLNDPKGKKPLINLPVRTPRESHKETFVTEDDHREKTVSCPAEDALMDVTQSHAVRFTTNDADMDETRSHTVNIATNLTSELHQSVNFSLPSEEKTAGLTFTADQATMDITQCLTTNITTNLASSSAASVRKRDTTCDPRQNTPSVRHSLNTGFSNPLTTGNPVIAQVTPTAAQFDGFTICPDDSMSMDITEAQIGGILEGDTSAAVAEVQSGRVGERGHLQSLSHAHGTHAPSVTLKEGGMTPHQQSRGEHGSSSSKETSGKSSLKTVMQRHQFDAEDDSREKTVRFAAAAALMDITRSHTVNIISDVPLCSFPIEEFPANATKTVRFTDGDADMDVTKSHTVKISADLNAVSDQSVNLPPATGEKTMRFTINDAAMDVTRSHTVNISTCLNQPSLQNVSLVPVYGEKTVRFTSNDADMDVTRSRTVNISAGLNTVPDPNVSQLPANGEKTVRFTTNDADMDVTRSHTVNIAADLNVPSHRNMDLRPANEETRLTASSAGMVITRRNTVNISTGPNVSQLPATNTAADLKTPSRQNMGLPANREKATMFAVNDATMDVTRSHTTNITHFEPKPNLNVDSSPANAEKTETVTANKASMGPKCDAVNTSASFEPKSHQNVTFHPPSGDKTVRCTTSDASMEMTRCLTVNIANNPSSELVLMDQNVLPAYENVGFPIAARKPDGSDSSSSAQLEQEFQKGDPLVNFAEATETPLLQVTADSSCSQLQALQPETSADDETPSLVLGVVEQPANETMTVCAEIGASMDVMEPQSGTLRPASTNHSHHKVSSAQDNSSDHLKKTELTSQNNGVPALPSPDDVDTNKMETMTAQQPRTESFPSSQKADATDAGQDIAPLGLKTSRQRSLACLQSKLRRMSDKILAAPYTVAIDGSTTPPSQLDPDLETNSSDKTTSLPEVQPELNTSLPRSDDNTGPQSRAENPSTAANATPFSLKTQQLMSTLSVGGFKPKLPQRNNPGELKKPASTNEATRTFADNVTDRLRDFDNDVEYVFNEELVSCEDMSETSDTRTPEKTTENERPSDVICGFEPAEEDLFKEPCVSPFHSRKRPPTEDYGKDEKRLKTCSKLVETEFQSVVESDAKLAAAHMTTQTDSSSNSSRYEAASESNFKTSMFESQLEDYGSDEQKKLKDGTITVLEFFGMFNIDFVTHNPRQSVLPGRLSSDTDVTPLDLLKHRHINCPKQMVYKADLQTLTTKVKELKVRLQDLNKPLRVVNQRLWEEMRHFSEEELQRFRAKLKERNNFFRKSSRVQSHETKEVLYSELVRVNLEEQQKLRGTISEADEMLKQLDGCIWELEAEINAVTEVDSKDKKCLKTLQEEFTKITDAVADNDRQISELELQKKQSSSKLTKLKTETKNLQSYIYTQNLLNEWRLREKVDDCTSYTFLHNTLLLQMMFEKLDGNDADSGCERKITNISFRFDLDDDESQFHARLVHKLVSQHVEGQSSWVEKYPTSRHVPQLLHDVSLVVSPCRLLGEELRLLKMWGALRFDILDIGCRETQVFIVFSSLKKLSKFEVVFAVGLTNQLCAFRVQSFRNIFGNTTIQQVEEIVASLTSDTKLFTKIVKKIHKTLLC